MFRWLRWLSLAFVSFVAVACSGCHDGAAPPANVPESSPNTAPSASALLLPGAPADAVPTPAGGADASGTIIRDGDDRKSFDVARGSVVTVALQNNAGTGYVWTPTHVDANVLTQQGDRTSDLSSGVPGGPKLDVYRFVATNPGTTAMELSLKRPFGSGAAVRTIQVTVNVH